MRKQEDGIKTPVFFVLLFYLMAGRMFAFGRPSLHENTMARGSLRGCLVVSMAFLAPALLYLGSLPTPAGSAPADVAPVARQVGIEPPNPERRYVSPLTEDIMQWRRPIARVTIPAIAPPVATDNAEAPKPRTHKTASRNGQTAGQRKREAAASGRLVQNDFGWPMPQTP